MKIVKLRVNHIEKPLGFQMKNPCFSWIVEESKGSRQKCAQIDVFEDEECRKLIYTTGRQQELNSVGTELPLDLTPRTRYFWMVSVWNERNEIGVSEISWFETGKMEESWTAEWITGTGKKSELYRKKFETRSQVKVASARIYICGLGLYELELNGRRIGNEVLTPGYHAYDFWKQVQTYDVTDAVINGENVIGVYTADGWYKGKIGMGQSYTDVYGDRQCLICELHINYADGTSEVIKSDTSWVYAPSPILSSSIYDGEIYDARKEISGWSENTCTYKGWEKSTKLDLDRTLLSDRLSLPVKIMEKRNPVQILHTPKGENILDFGQNMAGWIQADIYVPKGKSVRFQFGEILQDGCFYRDNLRTAKAEYIYTGNGKRAVIRPHFTYYGFRYVKVEGIEPDPEHFMALVLYSEMEQTGWITTGNAMVNQFVNNVLWGQKSNFLDLPTDCPQRDERQGWTGDAQIFSGTACCQMYVPAFFRKYLQDMRYEQSIIDGAVPHIVPRIKPSTSHGMIDGYGAAPWADAAVIIPWNLYLYYGDKSMLAEQYPGMKAWTDYVIHMDEKNGDKKRWTTGFHFADWLALDNLEDPQSPCGATESYFVASAYYYYDCMTMSKAAKILGFSEDEEFYSIRANQVLQSIRDEYFSPNGRCTIHTQTALVLAICINLVSDEHRQRCADDLAQMLKKRDIHLDTGFVGTPYICKALSETGYDSYAYQLFLNEDYPSWLYQVKMGATTVWERWDSVLLDGKMNPKGMNSLNHYAYGAVTEWIYQYVCGIRPQEDFSGFKKVKIEPHINGRMDFVDCRMNTASGAYQVNWKVMEDGDLSLKLKIPFDCEAEVSLPVAESINAVSFYMNNEKNELLVNKSEEKMQFVLTAGNYEISYKPKEDFIPRLSIEMTVAELKQYPEAIHVIRDYTGMFMEKEKQAWTKAENIPLEKLLGDFHYFQYYKPQNMRVIADELKKLKRRQ